MSLDKLANTLHGRNFLILGLGGLGKTVLEILEQMLTKDQKVFVVDPLVDQIYLKNANFKFSIEIIDQKVDKNNYHSIINNVLHSGDILLNFTNTCDSQDIITLCFEKNIVYQDTAWSWWKSGGEKEYSLNEQNVQIKEFKDSHKSKTSNLALINFGMNPGLISLIAEQALVQYKDRFGDLQADTKIIFTEYDSHQIKSARGKLVCTWSPFEFWQEFISPGEYYSRPAFKKTSNFACRANMKAWSKNIGIYSGYLVPHREVFSFVNSLDQKDRNKVIFSGFCYHPPLGSVEGVENFIKDGMLPDPTNSQVLVGAKGGGDFDEIGVLIGAAEKWLWLGYSYDLPESKGLEISTNSTLYLVAAATLSGLLASFGSDKGGVLEAEDFDPKEVLEISNFLIGKLEVSTPSNNDGTLIDRNISFS